MKDTGIVMACAQRPEEACQEVLTELMSILLSRPEGEGESSTKGGNVFDFFDRSLKKRACGSHS